MSGINYRRGENPVNVHLLYPTRYVGGYPVYFEVRYFGLVLKAALRTKPDT